VSEPFQFFTVAALLSISAGLPPPDTVVRVWSSMTALAAGVFWAGGLWRLVANV
jgi:hypothetical protein